MLRFATAHSRCSPGGATVCAGASRYATALPRTSAAELRCHYGESRKYDGKAPVLQHMNFNKIPMELIIYYVICKVQNSSYIPRQKRTAIRVGEKIGNGVINKTLPSYPRLSLIQKLFRIIQITRVQLEQTWFTYCFSC